METIQKISNLKNILLTGGHGATTGIAVIEAIKRKFTEVNISWIGSRNAVSGSKVSSLEYKTYPLLGVKYYSITAGKLQTKFTRYTIPLLLLIPVGFFQSLILMLKIKPQAVLSFGGYSSVPVVFWAWLFRIPIVLHEQTVVAGRASIATSFFARKIGLSRLSSLQYFPEEKSKVIGNPVSKNVLSVKPKTKIGALKTILVMGGSRGSEFINEEIIKIVPNLINKYNIIHITGERDYEIYKNKETKNYRVLDFVDPRYMDNLYNESDVIISRAGANTVSELLIIKRPVILIPLPRTFMHEQELNAKYAKDFGIAKVMLESEVNPKTLIQAINDSFSNWQKIVNNVIDKESPDLDASNKLVDLVVTSI